LNFSEQAAGCSPTETNRSKLDSFSSEKQERKEKPKRKRKTKKNRLYQDLLLKK
jgi:hypothetical protein